MLAMIAALGCEFHDVDGALKLHVIAEVNDVNKQPIHDAAIYIQSQNGRSNADATLACRTDALGRCDAIARHAFHGRTTRMGGTQTRIEHTLVIRAAGFREKVVPLSHLTRAQAEGQQPLVVSQVLSP